MAIQTTCARKTRVVPDTYLAHHELESVFIIIIVVVAIVSIITVAVVVSIIHTTCDMTRQALSVRAQKAKEPHGSIDRGCTNNVFVV